MANAVKVLITGGAGFIGYHLAKKLSEKPGYQITIVDDFSRGRLDDELQALKGGANVSFITGDLTNDHCFANMADDFDYIYHLAAVIGVRNVTSHPDKVLLVNATSTLRLFEHFKNSSHLKKIFFSSTSEIYAGTLHHFGMVVPTPETTPLTILDIRSPRTTYMLSKMYGESICHNYQRVYGIPCTIGRYHNVYGPRMGFQHVIPEMFVKLSKSETIEVASPEHTRAYCFIDDAIEMTIRATEDGDRSCQIYNIGSQEQEIKVVDLVSIIAKVMEVDPVIIEKEDIAGSPHRRCPEMKKLYDSIRYSPKTDLQTGITYTYRWYKNHLSDVYE